MKTSPISYYLYKIAESSINHGRKIHKMHVRKYERNGKMAEQVRYCKCVGQKTVMYEVKVSNQKNFQTDYSVRLLTVMELKLIDIARFLQQSTPSVRLPDHRRFGRRGNMKYAAAYRLAWF